MSENQIIAGLDVGTRLMRVLIVEQNEEGILQVAGRGEAPSAGIRRGVIVNIEAAKNAIAMAVEEAEQEAGRTVVELTACLGGSIVEGLNSRGVVAVSGKNREIRSDDVDRVIEAAKAVVIPMDREILHVIPQEYIIDDQGGVKDPLDMIGVRLEAEVHLATGSLSARGNLQKAVERAGYKLREVVQGTWAAAQGVLSEDEKELGTLLVDLGAGTTDYLLIQGGAPRLTGSLPVGGDQVTNDLSVVLKTPLDAAEQVKRKSGCCWEPLVDPHESEIIPGVGGRPPMPVPQEEICRILQPRMEEIFRLVLEDTTRKGHLSRLGGGVALVGGGADLLGAAALAGKVFNLPARTAVPKPGPPWPKGSKDPAWAALTGLVLAAAPSRKISLERGDEGAQETEGGKTFKEFLRWLGEFF